jgi:hypothetical protein
MRIATFLLLVCLAESAILADDPAITAVVAGLETIEEAYVEGDFEFRSATPILEMAEAGNPGKSGFRIVAGRYRWHGKDIAIDYREWTSEIDKLDLAIEPPEQSKKRRYVAGEKNSYHWFENEMLLIVSSIEVSRKAPEWIDVGPHGLWFTLDGQVALKSLLSKSLPPSNSRWVVRDKGKFVRIAMGKADKKSFYEFDFQVNDYVLPLGYRSYGADRQVALEGELVWHKDTLPPMISSLKAYRGLPDDALISPRIAFICGKMRELDHGENPFDLNESMVPVGTQVTHYQRPERPPVEYVKGGKSPELGSETELRELAEKIRGK